MRRLIATLAVASMLCVLAAFGWAYAAGLGPFNTDDLGSDTAVVAPCDGNGVSVAFTTNGLDQVTAVQVSGIAVPGCDGQTLIVTLVGGSNANVGDGSVVIAGDTDESVPINELPLVGTVARTEIAIQ